MTTDKGNTMNKTTFTTKAWGGYISNCGTWFVRNEGTRTWWYAVEVDSNGNSDESTKQYFRSRKEAETYAKTEIAKAVA